MGLKSFEADLLSVLLKDEKKFLKFSTRLKGRHFGNKASRWTYKVLNEHYGKYNALPTVEVFKNELLKTSFSVEKKKTYYLTVRKLYKRKPKSSMKYIEENMKEKIGQEEFLIAVDKSLKKMEEDGIVSAKRELIGRVLKSEEREGDIVRVLKDWEARQKLRKELKKIPVHKRFISTPYSTINKVTYGIQISEAATIAGLTGQGKSIVAGEFGVNSMLERSNVLHFTLENTAEQTAQRYDSRISDIEYDTIKYYKFSKSQIESFRETFRALVSGYENDVVIKETVRDETDIAFVDKTIEFLRSDGFDTEFLIADSCDIMKSMLNYKDYRLDRTSIYWDFKMYCKAKRIPGLTTTQLAKGFRREGREPTVEDLAEAYDKARILDIVYIMWQSEEDEKSDIVRFIVGKNRDGPTGARIRLWRNSAKMKFLELK